MKASSLRLSALSSLLAATHAVVVHGASLPTGAGGNFTLAPLKYTPLPLGSVKPSGWLKDQVELQANGLGGTQHTFYPLVMNSTWTGGNVTYSNLQESGSYYFNAIVPTAYILDDREDLKQYSRDFANYVIDHQEADGWLGPEPRILWGRFPFLLGLMQLADVEPTMVNKITDATYKLVNLSNSMLKNPNISDTGVEEWTAVRAQEYQIFLEWLYESHPRDEASQAQLLETMKLLPKVGQEAYAPEGRNMTWDLFFTDAVFPMNGTPAIDNFSHGVNLAMALKGGAVSYRYSHDQADIDSTYKRINLTFTYHGKPAGHFAADEHLAGLDPWRGAELCQIAEDSYSMSYNYQLLGDSSFADRVEKLLYNSLPGEMTGDMWSRQYLQQQNQVFSKILDPNPFRSDGNYSNVFGLEPNYPCCTVNHGQSAPKAVAAAFVTTPDKASLVHAYLGPFSVATTLSGGNKVQVVTDTSYPFEDAIRYNVTADRAFDMLVRIPQWAITAGKGTISMTTGNNGKAAAQPLHPDPLTGMQTVSVKAGTSNFVIDLPSEIEVVPMGNSSVAVNKGPLNYVIDIPFTTQQIQRPAYFYLPPGVTFPTPAGVQDITLAPNSSWNLAIDPSTLAFHNTLSSGGSSAPKLPSPVFTSGASPLSITAQGCTVAWADDGPWGQSAGPVPDRPQCQGGKVNVTLVPYGVAKLRIGDIPVMG